MKLRKQVEIIHDSTVLVGRVSSISRWEKPVVIAAYSQKMGRREIAHYTVLHEPGSYELMVPKGRYYIFAFGDENENLTYETGEPAGQYVTTEQVAASVGGVVSNLDFVISDRIMDTVDFPIGFDISGGRPKKLHSTLPGAIANLDDKLFSEASAKKGFWAPVEFFKDIGGNIYFLEPYDPDKIPIFFNGSRCIFSVCEAVRFNIDTMGGKPWPSMA